jgi:hypothetical protein
LFLFQGLETENLEGDMELKKYFENAKGVGVLATAGENGKVDAAVYARPHFMEDGTVAMIMRDRLTHHNLQSNPHAAYLFMEQGPMYEGRRLFLNKIREEEDSEMLYKLRRRNYPSGKERRDPKFLVFFEVTKVLPLIGPGE